MHVLSTSSSILIYCINSVNTCIIAIIKDTRSCDCLYLTVIKQDKIHNTSADQSDRIKVCRMVYIVDNNSFIQLMEQASNLLCFTSFFSLIIFSLEMHCFPLFHNIKGPQRIPTSDCYRKYKRIRGVYILIYKNDGYSAIP